MNELNENKTNEQNINENEPKKKRSKITILLVLILVGVVVYAGYSIAKPYIQQYIGKQGNAALESLKIGETYTYSEEQKEEFRQKATELMNKQVAEKNLQPGESYYYKDFWDDWKEHMADENGYVKNEQTKLINRLWDPASLFNVGYSGYKYNVSSLEAGNLFNGDLSLKEPNLFYGYTGVGEYSTKAEEYKGYYEDDPEGFTLSYDVYILKCLENAFKSSLDDELYNYLDEIYKENPSETSYGLKYFSKDDLENLSDYLIGYNYYWINNWLSGSNGNALHSLNMARLSLGIEGNINYNKIVDDYGNYATKESGYYSFNPKYNYYLENHNYFVTYVPSAITKLDDHVYMIDLEVDQPVDELGAAIIKNNLMATFKNQVDEQSNLKDLKLDIIVRIVYSKAPNYSNVSPMAVFDITHTSEYIEDVDGKKVDTMGEYPYWYPNDEAIAWVEDYFTLVKEAQDKGEQFSIFDLMKQVADKYNVSEKDVVSVILTSY